MKNENWRVWDDLKKYGDTFYNRATGNYAEMESAKSVSKVINQYYSTGKKVLDVGCGAGHYLRSFRDRVDEYIDYTGIDATEYYIELAKRAFPERKESFLVGDIYDLPFESGKFDIVMCNNVILHLPAPPTKAFAELLRVSSKTVIIRTLIGKRNYIIQEVYNPDELLETTGRVVDHGSLISEQGEPVRFNYFNIYTSDYVSSLCKKIDPSVTIEIREDLDFDEFDVGNEINSKTSTKTVNGMQVSGSILLDWQYIIITKT